MQLTGSFAPYRFFLKVTVLIFFSLGPQGNYRVVLGKDAEGEVLLSGGGDFGIERAHEFQVPTYFTEKQENPQVADGQIPLTVVIQLDSSPQDVGWRIERLDIQTEEVIRVPAGIYLTPSMIVVRTVVLEENELYHFAIFDMSHDGIENGKGTLAIHINAMFLFCCGTY